MTADIQKMIETQDLNYATMKRTAEIKKIKKLESSLNFLSEENSMAKHTVFVDDEEEADNFNVVEYFDTVPEMATRSFNRPRKETLQTVPVVGPKDVESLIKIRKQRDRAYTELNSRIEREKKIERVVKHLTTRKNLLVSVYTCYVEHSGCLENTTETFSHLIS